MVSYLVKTSYKGDNLELWYWNEEEQKIERKLKNDNHLPYLLTDEESFKMLSDKSKVVSSERVKKYDATKFSEVMLVKVNVKHPTDIFDKRRKTGLRTVLKNAWEDNISYDICYVIDTNKCYCLPDNVVSKSEETVEPEKLKEFFLNHFFKAVTYKFFRMPIKCLDIEVKEGRLEARSAEEEILCCSIVNEKYKRIYVNRGYLDSSIIPLTKILKASYVSTINERIDYEIIICNNEYELLKNVYEELKDEVILYTFNGDEFDLPYLYYRGKKLGFKEDDIPISVSFDGHKTSCTLKNGLHIDIQKSFEAGILTYSYPVERYPSLDDVALAITGERKLKQPSFNVVSKELCDYCLNDSELLFKIVTNDGEVFQLLLISLSRLYNISLEDLTRTSLSKLNYKLFQYAHRLVNYLIPNRKYFENKNTELKIPIGKSGSYKGGEVYISSPGIYFDIDVYDYTSEYPGVADAENISYETINCPHQECKTNIVPDHGFYICKKQKGIVSALLGAIRDLRIHFKERFKKSKSVFDKAIVGALKICVLSSYGMFGMKGHEIEMPAIASTITFYGRNNLSLGRMTVEELGYKCLYGDTDSIFTKHLSDKERERLIDELKRRTKIEIEYDKHYKYVIISRKKNYLGCSDDGRIDIKGMTGKKRHQCIFLKNVFNGVLQILRGINKIEDLNIAKGEIEKFVRDAIEKLKNRNVKLEDLIFKVRLSKELDSKGQPYDVARLYIINGVKKQPGDFVEYVLTKGVYRAKPVFMTRMSEIDVDSYIYRLEGMLKQIFEPLEMNVKEVLYGRNMSLESFKVESHDDFSYEREFKEGIEKWFEN